MVKGFSESSIERVDAIGADLEIANQFGWTLEEVRRLTEFEKRETIRKINKWRKKK